MLCHSILINSDNLIQLAYQLKQKIRDIETCYNEVKTNMREIDGTNENWQGEDQKIFYETLTYLTNKYEKNIGKLTEIYNFLCKTIDNYEKRDETFGRDLDRNNDNLDM